MRCILCVVWFYFYNMIWILLRSFNSILKKKNRFYFMMSRCLLQLLFFQNQQLLYCRNKIVILFLMLCVFNKCYIFVNSIYYIILNAGLHSLSQNISLSNQKLPWVFFKSLKKSEEVAAKLNNLNKQLKIFIFYWNWIKSYFRSRKFFPEIF